jgi:hypothetical protein
MKTKGTVGKKPAGEEQLFFGKNEADQLVKIPGIRSGNK